MLSEIRKALRQTFRGYKAYLVGGCVRDFIRSQTDPEQPQPHDIDVVVYCNQHELKMLGAKRIEGTLFHVYHLWVEAIRKTIQIALPRTERKTGYGYHGFSADSGSHIPLREDLARRDFTVNAIAMDIHTGAIIDPFGGRKDIENAVLRHIFWQAFLEDPDRFFRLLRFAAKGYNPAQRTVSLIQSHNWDKEFEALPHERVYTEIMKAMKEPYPERFFTEYLNIGVGKKFLPELFNMPTIPAGPDTHHPEDNLFAHCHNVLQKTAALTADPLARFCAFMHDLGKLLTPPEMWPHHYGHHKAGALQAVETLKRFKASNKEIRAVSATNELHMKAAQWMNLTHSSKVNLCRAASKAGITTILPIVVKADSDTDMPHWKEALAISHTSAPHLGIPVQWIHQNAARPKAIRAREMQERVNRIKRLFPA